jgi:hypothetical protein
VCVRELEEEEFGRIETAEVQETNITAIKLHIESGAYKADYDIGEALFSIVKAPRSNSRYYCSELVASVLNNVFQPYPIYDGRTPGTLYCDPRIKPVVATTFLRR